MLQVALERDGFEVVAVEGVEYALSCIAKENVDVLLTDLRMPHAGDGFTVVGAVRNTHPRAVAIPSWTRLCPPSAYRLTQSL